VLNFFSHIQEHRLRVQKNRVLKNIFGLREELKDNIGNCTIRSVLIFNSRQMFE